MVLAGLTAAPVGRLLGVRLPGRDGVAILGADAMGLELARALREGGRQVVFLDSNPEGIRRAEEAGFPVVYGDALKESVMQRARFGFVRTVVALTTNRTLNSVLVARARDRFFSAVRGAVAHQGERILCKDEVGGSSPPSSTLFMAQTNANRTFPVSENVAACMLSWLVKCH